MLGDRDLVKEEERKGSIILHQETNKRECSWGKFGQRTIFRKFNLQEAAGKRGGTARNCGCCACQETHKMKFPFYPFGLNMWEEADMRAQNNAFLLN